MLALKFKASIFARIAAGKIPCYKVAETDEYLPCLDINPLNRKRFDNTKCLLLQF